jgi:hypothetical protein
MREPPPVDPVKFVSWGILLLLFVLAGAVLAASAGGQHTLAVGATMLLTTGILFVPTAVMAGANEV